MRIFDLIDYKKQGVLTSSFMAKAMVEDLRWMLLIRNFEKRAEAAYQQGKIGGFFHSYMGQEAIQVAAFRAMGKEHWWLTTYRCHALALLLGATPEEMMAELYGKVTGNAQGRGGSMHLCTERLLGGFAIVGGHLPVALGAAFSLKYQGVKDKIAICFLGEGAVAQGAFHESMNLAALWDLPCLFVIENNQWGMGTAVHRALVMTRFAEELAPAYGIKGYTLNGMNYFECLDGFQKIYKEILETGRPILVEAVTERFRGHSISDPALYRSKEDLKKMMQEDPLLLLEEQMIEKGIVTNEEVREFDKEARERVLEAMKYAETSPWPNPIDLEEGVFA